MECRHFIDTTDHRKPRKKRFGFAFFAKQAIRVHTAFMQLNLTDAALFIRVAELGTLSAAARERNEPVSQTSRAIARIESALGVRLLHRSTHGLSLTDEGDTFLSHARSMLDIAAEMESELTGKLAGPSGVVRIGVSPILAQMVIAPSLPDLYALYPELRIDIAADDRPVDLARDGIDIAIRAGVDILDTLVARKISMHGRNLYASPDYLNKYGTPGTPAELVSHRLITNSASQSLNQWPFRISPSENGASDQTPARIKRLRQQNGGGRPGGENIETLHIKGHTRADNTAIVLSLALAGVGIARLNDLLVYPLVARGQLVQVLSPYAADECIPVYAVTLKERHRLPKIRACIDFWEARFAQLRTDQENFSRL
jgi:DNA-binding transcriptional LysR family regulator